MPRPFFQILQGATDVTARVGEGKIALTIVDGVGANADTVTFDIDDVDGLIAPPKTGVELRVIGGFEDDYRDFGIFIVDQVTLTGWPQKITVNAQTAAAKETLKQRRTGAFQAPKHKTYGEIFEELAGRNKLTLAMDADLKSVPVEYEAQSEENDGEFLTRIGDERLDASVTIKDKKLVVVKRGEGKSASGKKLPDIVITRSSAYSNIVSYTATQNDKPKHSTVKASAFNRRRAKTDEVEEKASSEGPAYRIRAPYQSTEEAQKAAKKTARRLRAAEGGASFVIDGMPSAMAEARVIVSGIRSLVDGTWRATQVTHSWSAGGPYTTTVECEKTGTDS